MIKALNLFGGHRVRQKYGILTIYGLFYGILHHQSRQHKAENGGDV